MFASPIMMLSIMENVVHNEISLVFVPNSRYISRFFYKYHRPRILLLILHDSLTCLGIARNQ